jgi:hypothetical protein
MNLGVALAGGNGARQIDDFYPTPPEATVALLERCRRYIGHVVHEPACGDGAMARVLEMYGHRVIATDLIDRGYGMGGCDYLADPPASRSIVTNPPFKLAAEFIEHSMRHNPAFCAMLVKATFWNAAKRVTLFNRFPLKMVLPLTWRLDFTSKGSPTMDCIWCVWGSNVPDGFVFEPLPKPSLGVFA